MIDVFERVGGPVLAVERVPREDVSSYGVIAVDRAPTSATGVYRVRDLVEKPPRDEAPSEPRDHRPLHPDARHLPGARGDARAIAPARSS